MKVKVLVATCLASLPLLIACASGQLTMEEQANQSADTAAPSATQAGEPTEEPFKMPGGKLLVYTHMGDEGGGYYVIILPDQTIELFR